MKNQQKLAAEADKPAPGPKLYSNVMNGKYLKPTAAGRYTAYGMYIGYGPILYYRYDSYTGSLFRYDTRFAGPEVKINVT